jgi:hypothetical protein
VCINTPVTVQTLFAKGPGQKQWYISAFGAFTFVDIRETTP